MVACPVSADSQGEEMTHSRHREWLTLMSLPPADHEYRRIRAALLENGSVMVWPEGRRLWISSYIERLNEDRKSSFQWLLSIAVGVPGTVAGLVAGNQTTMPRHAVALVALGVAGLVLAAVTYVLAARYIRATARLSALWRGI